ncbi:MAG: hypothetical protein CBB68_04255 [Rhodospirillaceae bacterium TMED8]|nr:hypothetical protein [Magnetovibrio sp.]OUT51550.1 MAG: hypothetical protein CBB68_04255 [Rhodospirillaceae bacterium TMED8]|tara:strand:+ start:2219 stop:2470 length:252 start_codon:yes stop_codon:yes gene_type:complete
MSETKFLIPLQFREGINQNLKYLFCALHYFAKNSEKRVKFLNVITHEEMAGEINLIISDLINNSDKPSYLIFSLIAQFRHMQK